MKLRCAAATVVIAAGVSLAGASDAGPTPFDYSPTSGPQGTTITASGGPPASGCNGLIRIGIYTLQGDLITDNGTGLFNMGTWEVKLSTESIPPGEYELRVTCSDPDTIFGPVPYTVTPPEPPPPPPTPTPEPQPIEPQPIEVQPAFTG